MQLLIAHIFHLPVVLISTHLADRFWGPPSLLFNGYREAPPRGVMMQGREAGHSPPSSTEVKNGGAVSPPLHILSRIKELSIRITLT
jgi:hypothetical protein